MNGKLDEKTINSRAKLPYPLSSDKKKLQQHLNLLMKGFHEFSVPLQIIFSTNC